MKNNTIGNKRLAQAVMAVMVSGLGAYANANDFALNNNGLTISVNNVTIATATLDATSTNADATKSGTLTTTSMPEITVNSGNLSSGIPTFSFNLALPNTAAVGNHTFRVGLVITDNADPTNRRFEAFIDNLVLAVAADKTVTGTIPAQNMTVAAKKGSVNFNAAINNASQNGPISVNGSSITVSGSQAVTELRSRNNSIINAVLNDFALNGTFTFRVIVEQVSKTATTDARLGITSSGSTGFTAMSKINASTLYALTTSTFTNAASSYAIAGQFRAVPAPATGGTTTPTVAQNVATISGGASAVSSAANPAAGAAAIGNVASSLATIASSVQGGTALSAADIATITTSVNSTLTASATLLNTAAAAGDTAAVNTAVTNLVSLMNNLSTARIPATTELLTTVQTVATAVVSSVVRSVLGSGATEAQITTALSTNAGLLDTVLSRALPLPPVVIRSQAEVSAGVQAGVPAGTPAAVATKLAAIVTGQLLAPDSFRSPGGLTVGNLLRSLLGLQPTSLSAPLMVNDERSGTVLAATGQLGVTTDAASGVVKITLPAESYVGMISAIKAVPSSVPTGIRIRRNGSALIVTGGVAIELAPMSLGFLGFAAAVEKSGFGFSVRNDGSVSLDLGQGNRFAGAFAYDNLTSKDLNVACGTVTIVNPTGSDTSPNYAFGVNCSSGVQQRVVPYVDNANFFTALDAGTIPFSVDRNTGVITSTGNGRFKPSFFVSPRTAAETTFHTANKNAQGIAFQAMDVNGDGRMDFKVIGDNGTQVLFGIN